MHFFSASPFFASLSLQGKVSKNWQICLLFFFSATIFAQPDRIIMEGEFADWQNVPVAHSDPLGDPAGGIIDFGRLWITNDENYLFLRLEISGETTFQDFNDITLYIDTDNNAGTGLAIAGIGAELEWTFGDRDGFFRKNGTTGIYQNDIGIVSAPTVTSTEFEVSLDRSARPDNSNLLFPVDDIRVYFRDKSSGQDELPDVNGGVPYTFSDNPLPALPPIPIVQKHSDAIRILSYNVLTDGLFEPARQPAFNRILKALQPKIIGFQEIYNHNNSAVINQVEQMLPSAAGEQWYGASFSDNFMISRYPITSAFGIEGNSGFLTNGAFLLDLRPEYDSDMLCIVAHTPCCSNDAGRQYEIDAMMAFIRDAKNPGGVLTLANETPIVIMGDMNLVGESQQLRTFLTGQIINTGAFGASFSPDWDGGHFEDLLARHTDLPMTFTWYSENSSFSPGRLDFMIYSGSVMEPLQNYVLFTPALPADTLAAYNLLATDAVIASDHLPVISDFRLTGISGISTDNEPLPEQFFLAQNYPNPFNPETTLEFYLPVSADISLRVYDGLGREVSILTHGLHNAGQHTVKWAGNINNGKVATSGVYYAVLKIESSERLQAQRIFVRKLLLMK